MDITSDHFRHMAYTKAAEALEVSGTLDGWSKLPGVGKSIRTELEQVLAGGVPDRLAALRAGGPPETLLELLQVSGIGANKALALHSSGISSLADLNRAVLSHTIADPQLVHSFYALRAVAGTHRRSALIPIVEDLTARLLALPDVVAVEPIGHYRRKRPDLKSLELLVTAQSWKQSKRIMDALAVDLGVQYARFQTDTNLRSWQFMTTGDVVVPVALTFCDVEETGCALFHFTGTRDFHKSCDTYANELNIVINAYSITINEVEYVCPTEADLFNALGLPFVPPEFRERFVDFTDDLPQLLTHEDIVGDLHVHTTASTGIHSIAKLQASAKRLGHKVMGIADNFRNFGSGVRGDAVTKHQQAIADAAGPLPVLLGAEVDIRVDGSLDVEFKTLKDVRYIILAINAEPQRLALHRYSEAIASLRAEFPNKALAVTHPGCRKIGVRGDVPLDWGAFYKMCSVNNVAIDINGDQTRADPTDDALVTGKTYRCKFLLGSDTKAEHHMQTHMDISIAQANRALLARKDILNTSAASLKHWLAGYDLRRLG